jgi:HD-like signal output (HDOD) protein/CheY-like chemotaxis protein
MLSKRILFVDDEQMLLDGLRRALYNMRNEWEMVFVDHPAAALELLDQKPFDAIVSDIRMPGMDGAELLERVKERHGSVVRIVLSGQSSKETLLRSIAPAHQFLSKPCNIEELKSRLLQAFAARDLLRNPALASIASRLRTIPSLPSLHYELTAALESEDTSLATIEQIVSRDAAMAAKILQLANSAFIGMHGRVSSLREAVSLIGAEMVRSLALSIHIFSRFKRNSPLASYLPGLWEHSLAVAWLAERIAISETGNKAIAEEAFSSGLLHEVGKIVLFAERPNEYRRVLEQIDVEILSAGSGTLRALEMEYVGCSHEQIGAYLISIWGLPPSIVASVEFHSLPSGSGKCEFSALTAAHCADAIASESDPLPLNHDVELEVEYLRTLGLLEQVPKWRGFHERYLEAKAEKNAEPWSPFS